MLFFVLFLGLNFKEEIIATKIQESAACLLFNSVTYSLLFAKSVALKEQEVKLYCLVDL